MTVECHNDIDHHVNAVLVLPSASSIALYPLLSTARRHITLRKMYVTRWHSTFICDCQDGIAGGLIQWCAGVYRQVPSVGFLNCAYYEASYPMKIYNCVTGILSLTYYLLYTNSIAL